MAEDHEECLKHDAWSAQQERNLRYERTFEKIEEHMKTQTDVMVQLAKQGEQSTFIIKRIEEFNEAKNILFRLAREQDEKLTAHVMEAGKESLAASRTLKNGALLTIIAAAIGILVKQIF